MWKTVALVTLALALGAVGGWWFRSAIAVDTCLDMGGQWLAPGYCKGAAGIYFE
jgi:hypothetical protein